VADEAKSAADILKGGGNDWHKLKEFVDETITVLEFRSVKGKNGDFPVIKALTPDAEEVEIAGGSHLLPKLQELEAAGFLPLDVIVEEFETQFPNPGYGFRVEED